MGLSDRRLDVASLSRPAGGRFSIEVAAHAYSVLDSYIYGFTLNEQSSGRCRSTRRIGGGGRCVHPARLPAGEYPHLTGLRLGLLLSAYTS
jgi:hypothetical protein